MEFEMVEVKIRITGADFRIRKAQEREYIKKDFVEWQHHAENRHWLEVTEKG